MRGKGKLIALDGSGNPSMAVAVKRLVRLYSGAKSNVGVSKWDASAIFFDILEGSRDIAGATPRTLLLLYATDLAFRLRWEIEPALAEGTTVIAAPYLETAFAFAKATGVPSTWVKDLLSFAPRGVASFRVSEVGASAKTGKPAENFLEFCFLQLRRGKGQWATEDARTVFLEHLKTLESRGKCQVATERSLAKGA